MSIIENVLLKWYLQMKKNRKIWIILDIDDWLLKSEFCKLLRTRSNSKQFLSMSNLLIYIYLYCVRSLLWSATTLDILTNKYVVSSNKIFNSSEIQSFLIEFCPWSIDRNTGIWKTKIGEAILGQRGRFWRFWKLICK